MPKLDLTTATRIKVAGGEVLALKGQGFAWAKASAPSIANPLPPLSVSNFAFWDSDNLALGPAPASWPATETAGMGDGMAWDASGTPAVELDPNGRKWMDFSSGVYFKSGQSFPADMAMSVWTMFRPGTSSAGILYNGPEENTQVSNRIYFSRPNMFFQVGNGNHSYSGVISSGDGPLTYLWSRPTGGSSTSIQAWQENDKKSFSSTQARALSLDAPVFVWGGSKTSGGLFSYLAPSRSTALLVTFGEELSEADRDAMQAWAVARRAAP